MSIDGQTVMDFLKSGLPDGLAEVIKETFKEVVPTENPKISQKGESEDGPWWVYLENAKTGVPFVKKFINPRFQKRFINKVRRGDDKNVIYHMHDSQPHWY